VSTKGLVSRLKGKKKVLETFDRNPICWLLPPTKSTGSILLGLLSYNRSLCKVIQG